MQVSVTRCLSLLEDIYIGHMKFVLLVSYFLILFCVIVCLVVCFLYASFLFCKLCILIFYVMYSYCNVMYSYCNVMYSQCYVMYS